MSKEKSPKDLAIEDDEMLVLVAHVWADMHGYDEQKLFGFIQKMRQNARRGGVLVWITREEAEKYENGEPIDISKIEAIMPERQSKVDEIIHASTSDKIRRSIRKLTKKKKSN